MPGDHQPGIVETQFRSSDFSGLKADIDEALVDNDDDDARTETEESVDGSPASNFYYFANQEIPAFNYDMMENKF